MDWRSVKFDWNRARAFLITAEEGSLSAAARALNMAQPTLGRQVTALEEELGVVLFQRVGLGLVLTPCGEELMDHVRAMGDAASRVTLAAAGQSQAIDGVIRITASEVVTAYQLPPILAKLRQTHPNIEIELIATSHPSDLRKREADIAIRSFRPTQHDLIAKKIKDVPIGLYATKAYIESLDHPTSADQLQEACFIGFDRTDALMDALNSKGLKLTQNNFQVLTENHIVNWELVKAGMGIGVMPTDIGAAEPKVEQLLPELDPIIAPMWLVSHRELNTSKRIRLVFDLLSEELAKL